MADEQLNVDTDQNQEQVNKIEAEPLYSEQREIEREAENAEAKRRLKAIEADEAQAIETAKQEKAYEAYEAERVQGLSEDDVRRANPEDWGLWAHTKDIATGAVAGVVDTISSISTAPERIADMAGGHVYYDEEKGYNIDKRTGERWDPSSDDWLNFGGLTTWGSEDNPLEAKGTAGKMVQMATHFISEAYVIAKTFGAVGKLTLPVRAGTIALSKGKNIKTALRAGRTIKAIRSGRKARAAAQLAAVNKGLPWYQKAVHFNKGEMAKDLLLIGAGQDILSRHSQGHSMAGALKKMKPELSGVIDTASFGLATKDTDSPLMMTAKNTLEGAVLGSVAWMFAPLSVAMGRGGFKGLKGKAAQAAFKTIRTGDAKSFDNALLQVKKTANPSTYKALKQFGEIIDSANSANDSRWDQILEHGEWQAADATKQTELGGYKNIGSGYVDGHQHNPIHITDVDTALSNNRKIKTDYGSQTGSVGSVTKSVTLAKQARLDRTANDGAIKEVLKSIKSSKWVQGQENAIRQGTKTLSEAFGDSIQTVQQISRGRSAVDWEPEYYLQQLREGGTEWATSTGNQIELTKKNMIAADLLISSLSREIRDTATGTRLIQDFIDVGDVDGPAQQLMEKFVTLVGEVERSKLLATGDFGKSGSKLNEVLNNKIDESIKSLQLAIDIAKDQDNDDMFRNIFELISQAEDIHNLTDFNQFIKNSLRGGNFKGKLNTAEWITQSQGVMVHSILSGPKTPLRAIMGTGSAVFLRPLSTAIGASLPGTADVVTRRAALSSFNAVREAIPEAWELFNRRLKAYWDGDVSTIKTRYKEVTQSDIDWKVYASWVENSGEATAGDKFAFIVANQMKALNDNAFFTYSTKVMAATDDAFGHLLGRAKAREKAVRAVLDQAGPDGLGNIDQRALKQMEDNFMNQIFDINGNITDEALAYAKKEATLTNDLTGFSAKLNDAFNSTPALKPFFLFARTGINGLNLTAKHTPVFNFLVREFNEIMWASADDLTKVRKYGINNPIELANAKALATGRLAIGTSVIGLGTAWYAMGNLSGNGPLDERKKRTWLDAGWKPRSIKVGNVWASYDAFEPFTPILSLIADIGDYQQLMGDEWTENQFQKLSLIVMQGAASKTYLSGLQQLIDLLSGRPGQQNRIFANLINNQIPMAGLRNELGKLFNPYTKEMSSGIIDSIKNRNQLGFGLTDMPVKYDILDGKPIKDHNFLVRAWNMFSPVQLHGDYSRGRQFLFSSGYDITTNMYTAPDGTDLSDSPVLRSKMQKAMGDQNLDEQLKLLSMQPHMIRSLRQYQRDLKNGVHHNDPKKVYPHLTAINNLFRNAKSKAWAKVRRDEDAQKLIKEKKEELRDAAAKRRRIQYNIKEIKSY